MEWATGLFCNGQSWPGGTATAITHGIQSNNAWRFRFAADAILNFYRILQTNPDHKGPLIDINVVTFHWEFNATPAFANLLARLPKWAFPVASTASLQAYSF